MWKTAQQFRKAEETSGMRECKCLGLRWYLDMSSGISRAMVRNGVWEPETTALVCDFVKPGMQALAVGANFGYYALLMARQVGPKGHVWAFEPTRKFREQLERNVEANHFSERISVLPFGLSDSFQSVTFQLMTQSASIRFASYHPLIGTEIVDLKPLDAVAADLGIERVDFVQMDIDGHEASFFRGAKKTLEKNHPPIAMEFSEVCLYAAGSSVREVSAILRDLDYDICPEKTRKPYKDDFEFLLDCGNFDHHANAVAIHSASAAGSDGE